MQTSADELKESLGFGSAPVSSSNEPNSVNGEGLQREPKSLLLKSSGSQLKKRCIRLKTDKVRMLVGKDVKIEEIPRYMERAVVDSIFSSKFLRPKTLRS